MTDIENEIPDDGETTEAKPQPIVTFNINDKRIAEVKEELKDVDAHKDLAGAKAAKTKLTKMRTALADSHKVVKADALAYCQLVDGEKRRLLELIGEIEDPITADLKAIKEKADNEEAERVGAIMGRIEELQAFALDRHDLTLAELNQRLETLLAREITEELYEEYLEDADNAKTVSESKLRIAIGAAEERAEAARKAEEQEEENRQLREKLAKQEAEQKEKDDLAAAEQRKRDDEAAEKLRKENEEKQAELDKQAEEQAAEQKKIDDENQRIADEQAEKDRKEAEEKAAAIAAIQAPDKDKLVLFADAVGHLINVKPTLQSDLGNEILLDAVANLIEIESDTRRRSEEL